MEYMTEILIVFGVLIAVAVAAVSYEVPNPYEGWLQLAARYETARRPSEIQFTGQFLMFGKKRVKRLNDFARFDTAIDDYGLWIVYTNNDQDEIPSALKIPGTHVRFEVHHGQQYIFQIYAEPPIRMAAKGEFGEALMNKVKGAPDAP